MAAKEKLLLHEQKSVESIKLHAPTNSTQKLKLMGRGGQFTYIPTLPLTWRLPQASDVEYEGPAIILF